MVTELTEQTFGKEVKQHNGVVVVDFWAPWCGPCKMMGPVFEKLHTELGKKIKFVKVNVDENGKLAEEYGILSIPCVVFLKDGEEVERVVGFGGEDSLREKVKEFVA